MKTSDYRRIGIIFTAIICFLLPGALVTRFMHTFVEASMILLPVLGFSLWGKKWMSQYTVDRWTVLAILIFILFTVIPQFIPFHFSSGLDSIRSFHLKFALIFSGVFVIFSNKTLTGAFLWGCIFAMFLATFWGLYEFFLGAEALPWESAGHPSYISPFNYHVNEFGAYFAYFLPIIISAGMIFTLMRKNKYIFIIPHIILWIAAIIALLLTGSRASQGGFIIAMLIFSIGYLVKYPDKKVVLGFSAVLVMSIVTIWLFISYNEPALSATQNWLRRDNLMSVSSRGDGVWPEYIEQIRPNIWFGLNFSRDLKSEYLDMERIPWGHEHNMYLRFIVDSGVVGLVGFIVLFLAVLTAGFKRLLTVENKRHYLLLLGVYSSFIGALLVRSIVAKYYHFQLEYMTSMVLALSCLHSAPISQPSSPDDQNDS